MAVMLVALAIRAISLAAILAVGSFANNLYRQRLRFRSLATKYGIPIMPHNFFLGHLIIAGKVAKKYPRDIATSLVPYLIAIENPEFSERGYFYLDMWPVAYQMIVVSDPDLMAQFTQDTSFPKHKQMPFEFGPFTHGVDLVTSNGNIWKTWRSIFSPGFSSKNIQTYIPSMIEEFNVFRSKLKSLADRGDTVNMDRDTMALTVDIIGHAVLGANLNAQTTGCDVFNALKRQIALLVVDYSPLGLSKLLNPYRQYQIWSNDREMDSIVRPYILSGIRDQDRKEGTNKTMQSLAVKSYRNEFASEGGIDAQWINIAVNQFKMLLFAGHDTVSSTFCFVTALLHNHPAALAKCREEFDSVFGPAPESFDTVDPAQSAIESNPEILNKLVYLNACIKETLRMFGPVSGSVRQAASELYLHHPAEPNKPLPTWDLMLFAHQAHLHRDPNYWPRPHEFIPERFLAKEGDELYKGRHKNAFRPFEMGSRNCIGQEFAMTELRLVLALSLREWDFEPVIRGADGKEAAEFFGMKGIYQVTPKEEITMHPRDGMPMRVRRRAG